MNKKIKKNTIMVCIIMIFIHILGLVYQILSNSPTLSILLKELFIVIFISQIILIKFEIKYAKYICYTLNLVIIIISGIYMDFASVIISILLMFYISSLYTNFENIDNLHNNQKNNTTNNNIKNTNKKRNNNRTKNGYKAKSNKDVK